MLVADGLCEFASVRRAAIQRWKDLQTLNERVIRVFVSSTFRDMHAEREELVKRVFPQLRKLCEQRGVVWGEVDLRWGVTDEQKAEGKVLPICLAEIQRCRPYFIGLLGERYGWVPDEIPEELIEQEPWLAEHLNHSVTELEILHGVLNDPEMADHAFFYFRDPAYVEHLPQGADPADFRSEDEDSRSKLLDLKARIRGSRLPVRENYADPKALGQLVLDDLTEVIDRLYPEGSQPDPLDRDAAEHEAFAQSRARVYIGREECFRRLDEHAAGDGPPLVVLGESGSGKSALLANWAIRYRDSHPKDLLIMHFIGASPNSADWAAMLRRIMGEFKRRFEIGQDIPDKPDELRVAFANWLHMAAAKGRVVLILDALNQLEDRDGAPDLVWLPPVIPTNVRLVLSTLPGRPLDDLTKREWPTLTVEPLTEQERALFIEQYLAQYTKALSPARARRIAAAPQSANPLYLQALLEELRVFGAHERLDERIAHYLEADTVPALYRKILARWEEDYDSERAGLVRDSMSLIWAARRGLSEAELLEMLGDGNEPLPRAVWSPFQLAADQGLVNRSGLIGFFHEYLREAVAGAYLPGDGDKHAAHLRLARYFESRDLDPRKLDELPWQLAQGEQWEGLFDLLCDPSFLETIWEEKRYEVQSYWAALDRNMPSSLERVYERIGRSVTPAGYVFVFSQIMSNLGYVDPALSLARLLANDERDPDPRAIQHLGSLLEQRGELDQALKLQRQAESISREAGDLAAKAAALGSQASVLYRQGALDEAMALWQEEERLCAELGDRDGLQTTIGNQAILLAARGEMELALERHREEERICREVGNRESLQACLGNRSLLLRQLGRWDEAMASVDEAEKICRELGYKLGLAYALSSRARILSDRGEYMSALQALSEQEEIGHAIRDQWLVANALGGMGQVAASHGEFDTARELLKRQEAISRELGDSKGIAGALEKQAGLLASQGDGEGAMRAYREQEAVYRDSGDDKGAADAIANQAILLMEEERLDEATERLRAEEELCRKSGYDLGLSNCIGNKAVVSSKQGDLHEALRFLEEQESVCRRMKYMSGLSRCLQNKANTLGKLADLEGALSAQQEAEQVRREMRDYEGVAQSLMVQISFLTQMRRLHEAIPLVEDAHRLAVEHSLDDIAERTERMMAALPLVQAPRSAPSGKGSLQMPDAAHMTAYRGADPERAAELNRQYQEELAEWKALPWLRRMRTKRPDPPKGI